MIKDIRNFLLEQEFLEKDNNIYIYQEENISLFAMINPYTQRFIMAAKNKEGKSGLKVSSIPGFSKESTLNFYYSFI